MFSDFIISDDCIGKLISKSISLYPVFVRKNWIQYKKGLFIEKKYKMQVIISMIIPTRSSERIFNAMRYTGNIYIYLFILSYNIISSCPDYISQPGKKKLVGQWRASLKPLKTIECCDDPKAFREALNWVPLMPRYGWPRWPYYRSVY